MVTRRLIPSVTLTPDRPALAGGRPSSPKYQGSYWSEFTVLRGIGHVRVFADPDPVWGGAAWTTPPPSAPDGSHLVRWTARSLPDPANYGGEYLLGTRDSTDGTAGLPAKAAQWDAADGSDYAIPWQSAYPFKPRVANYIHHGHDGTTVRTPTAVHFTAHHVQHMWADFGTLLNYPFTFMIVCVFTSFHPPHPISYVLDGGRDPTTTISAETRKQWWRHGIPARTKLSTENLGYRTGLQARLKRVVGFTDQNPSSRVARVPFAHNHRPKVIYGVYNGASSVFGVFGNALKTPRSHVQRRVKLASVGTQRFLVMGRRNGVIDNAAGAHMVLFEVRLWDSALTDDQLEGHYHQLASTWRFVEHA